MTRARPGSPLFVVFALALSSAALSAAARGQEPGKELRVPSAPSDGLADQLATMKQSLPAELHASFAVVVADAHLRLRASERAAAEGEGEPLAIADACRAAVLAADLAGASKRKRDVVDALVALTALQLTFDLHAALRERVGRQLAIRAVRACKDSSACMDAIVPTTDMPASDVAAVRRQFEGKAKELEAADRLGNFEIQQLGTIYEETTKQTSKIMANAHELKKSLIANFPR